MTTPAPAVAMTIAGSDCSAGAGIQADLKTFQDFGVHGLSAITSIVAETPVEVQRIEAVEIPLLQAQVNLLLDTYPVSAVKTGLLPTRMSIIAVAEIFRERQIPLVVDPVMIASTGSSLLHEDTTADYINRLLPCTTLVTPNIPEAESILKRKIDNEEALEEAARDIASLCQVACLVKGGHLPGNGECLDVLWHGDKAHHFHHARVDLPGGMHGTGCTLSAAITAGVACGQALEEAVARAIDYVQKLIGSAHTWQAHGKNVRCLGW